MIVGGAPDELDRLANQGRGQAFTLDHTGRWLVHVGRWHRASTPDSRVQPFAAVARLHAFAARIVELDRWVRQVAHALRVADQPSLQTNLLALGLAHPLARATGVPSTRDVRSLQPDHLDDLAALPQLPGAWRDVVHRERLRRWVDLLEERIAAVAADDHDAGPLGSVTRWFDNLLVDRLSPVTDLHVTSAETVDRLRAEVAGARRLLRHPDLAVWSFDVVDGRPTARVALGDPGAATHLAVLLPGTSSGLHAVGSQLDDAVALHDHATRLAAPGAAVATVLDLHAAPLDLGAAADPSPSVVAGAATGAFLDDLPASPRTTLIGHSYGALTASRATDHHAVDDLVLLGAPGAGVDHRDDLPGAERVWAARAAGDPIGAVADLDEYLQWLPPDWRPTTGPLADPLVAHGPDPVDPEFGAQVLPTAATGPGIAPPPARGHLDYLRPGTVSLGSVAAVVVGLARAERSRREHHRDEPG